jgi:hypothetical protein
MEKSTRKNLQFDSKWREMGLDEFNNSVKLFKEVTYSIDKARKAFQSKQENKNLLK